MNGQPIGLKPRLFKFAGIQMRQGFCGGEPVLFVKRLVREPGEPLAQEERSGVGLNA